MWKDNFWLKKSIKLAANHIDRRSRKNKKKPIVTNSHKLPDKAWFVTTLHSLTTASSSTGKTANAAGTGLSQLIKT